MLTSRERSQALCGHAFHCCGKPLALGVVLAALQKGNVLEVEVAYFVAKRLGRLLAESHVAVS